MNAVLQDTPLPARLVPWPAASPTTLTRCVLLALLLHVWLIVLLGSTPGGTVPPRQGVLGAINVTLRGPVSAGALPRWGGAVRSTDIPPLDQPGAARLGTTATVPQTVPETASAPAPAAALPGVAPAALPDFAPSPTLPVAPPAVRRLQAAPAAARAPEPALSSSAEVQVVTTAAAAALLPPSNLLSAPLPTERPGAPVAGSEIGRDVATPLGPAASAPPKLNLQLNRPRGGELSRFGGTAGALPVLPRPPERDDKLAKDIEKTGKTDCRNAYTGMGPLAVIPLAIAAVRKDGGCKW